MSLVILIFKISTKRFTNGVFNFGQPAPGREKQFWTGSALLLCVDVEQVFMCIWDRLFEINDVVS